MARSDSPPISVSRRGSARGDAHHTVVWVRGEHDIATRATLAVTLARAAQLDDVPLLVDLSAVTFMDASTVGAIVGSRNRLRARAQSLELRSPSRPALRVLELCGLAHLIHREPLRPTDGATALGTWVDVVPVQPSGGTDAEAARVTARPRARQPAGALATAHVHIEDVTTTIEVDPARP